MTKYFHLNSTLLILEQSGVHLKVDAEKVELTEPKSFMSMGTPIPCAPIMFAVNCPAPPLGSRSRWLGCGGCWEVSTGRVTRCTTLASTTSVNTMQHVRSGCNSCA